MVFTCFPHRSSKLPMTGRIYSTPWQEDWQRTRTPRNDVDMCCVSMTSRWEMVRKSVSWLVHLWLSSPKKNFKHEWMDQTKTSGYEREIIGDLRFEPGFFPMPWPMDLERGPERTSTRAFLMIRLKLLTGCACASRPGRWSRKHGETIMYSCIAWSLTPGVSTKFIQFIVMFLIQYCLRAQPSESCKSFYIVNQCHSVNRISSLDIFRCEFCRGQACLFGSNMVHGWVNQLNLYSSRLNVLAVKGKVFGIHIASKNHYFVHRAQGQRWWNRNHMS